MKQQKAGKGRERQQKAAKTKPEVLSPKPSEAVFGGRPQRAKQAKGTGKVQFEDVVMQGLLEKHGAAPFHPNPIKIDPPFRTLVSSIVGQQLSGKAAETIWKRLETAFAVEPQVLLNAKPDDLRALGLSWGKVSYIQDLSRFALEGGLEDIEHLEDALLIERLVKVKGIGVWSVQMYLMFGLGRPDVWPTLDLGVRKGIEKMYGITDKKELEVLGERFRPFRSHAAWLMWRCLEHT